MRLGLAGDTMLGRNVAARLQVDPPESLFAPELVEVVHEADLLVLNLECAISERGERWPEPGKPFFFRAPPVATEALRLLGVDCVTLANNHALDYGRVALIDTLDHLRHAGIRSVGAGPDERSARQPVMLHHDQTSVAVLGVTDHPASFAATDDRPGVAYADLRSGDTAWLLDAIADLDADVRLVTPHWGPNMVTEPVRHVRKAAQAIRRAGATIVAGHSAHVFHGVADRVLYDLGDFIDDYAVSADLRNDLGLFFLVTFDDAVATRIEAVPVALDHCHTRLADAREARWIVDRFQRACARLGTTADLRGDRLVIDLPATGTD